MSVFLGNLGRESYFKLISFNLWRVISLLKMAGDQLCKQYLTVQKAVDERERENLFDLLCASTQ